MRRPSFLARQSSRPVGLLGRVILGIMARETARFNAEVVEVLAPAAREHILEIGYGHGRTLAVAAARAPGASFAGIDIAPSAAAAAARRCRRAVAEGRVELVVGDGVVLPWPATTFAAAFSVHTLYFWSEPARQLAELRRVLRPEARVVLGFRRRSAAAVAQFPAPTYRFYDVEEVAELLVAAGLLAVAVRASTASPELWIATGRAPP